MKVFDFNIHLPNKISNRLKEINYNETDIPPEVLFKTFSNYSDELHKYIDGGQIMIFDQNFFNNEDSNFYLNKIKDEYKNIYFSCLVNLKSAMSNNSATVSFFFIISPNLFLKNNSP